MIQNMEFTPKNLDLFGEPVNPKFTPENDANAWLHKYKAHLNKIYVEYQDPFNSDGQICSVRPYLWVRMRRKLLPIPCWIDEHMGGPYAEKRTEIRTIGKGNPIAYYCCGSTPPEGSRIDTITGICSTTTWPEGHESEFWCYHNRCGKPTHYVPLKATALYVDTFNVGEEP